MGSNTPIGNLPLAHLIDEELKYFSEYVGQGRYPKNTAPVLVFPPVLHRNFQRNIHYQAMMYGFITISVRCGRYSFLIVCDEFDLWKNCPDIIFQHLPEDLETIIDVNELERCLNTSIEEFQNQPATPVSKKKKKKAKQKQNTESDEANNAEPKVEDKKFPKFDNINILENNIINNDTIVYSKEDCITASDEKHSLEIVSKFNVCREKQINFSIKSKLDVILYDSDKKNRSTYSYTKNIENEEVSSIIKKGNSVVHLKDQLILPQNTQTSMKPTNIDEQKGKDQEVVTTADKNKDLEQKSSTTSTKNHKTEESKKKNTNQTQPSDVGLDSEQSMVQNQAISLDAFIATKIIESNADQQNVLNIKHYDVSESDHIKCNNNDRSIQYSEECNLRCKLPYEENLYPDFTYDYGEDVNKVKCDLNFKTSEKLYPNLEALKMQENIINPFPICNDKKCAESEQNQLQNVPISDNVVDVVYEYAEESWNIVEEPSVDLTTSRKKLFLMCNLNMDAEEFYCDDEIAEDTVQFLNQVTTAQEDFTENHLILQENMAEEALLKSNTQTEWVAESLNGSTGNDIKETHISSSSKNLTGQFNLQDNILDEISKVMEPYVTGKKHIYYVKDYSTSQSNCQDVSQTDIPNVCDKPEDYSEQEDYNEEK